jgi:glycine cleavage system H lipoate-binding protein
MPESIPVDIFATKGAEYLLVIFFLAALVLFWRYMQRPARSVVISSPTAQSIGIGVSWFQLPKEIYYHPGHSWALPGTEGVVTIGVDDFAQKLIGEPNSIDLPEIGSQLEQGAPAWSFKVDDELVELLSPVDGEVIALNPRVLDSPDLINRDPYGEGWLMKVKTEKMKPNLNSLLHEKLAGAWMNITESALRQRMAGDLGAVLQDGGIPVTGIARSLSEDKWGDLVKDFLLTK